MQYRIEYDRNRLAGSGLFPAGDKTSTRREHDQGCLTAKVTIVSPPSGHVFGSFTDEANPKAPRSYSFSIGATRNMRRLTPAEPKSTVMIELRPLSCVCRTVPKPN